MILIILVRLFYLSVLYLSTERLAKPYKSMCRPLKCRATNVYVPPLLRMENYVEENPGPTVYNVFDPNKTISADFS